MCLLVFLGRSLEEPGLPREGGRSPSPAPLLSSADFPGCALLPRGTGQGRPRAGRRRTCPLPRPRGDFDVEADAFPAGSPKLTDIFPWPSTPGSQCGPARRVHLLRGSVRVFARDGHPSQLGLVELWPPCPGWHPVEEARAGHTRLRAASLRPLGRVLGSVLQSSGSDRMCG